MTVAPLRGRPGRTTSSRWSVLDVALIVAGSTGMVQAALALGDRWRISGAVLGVLILAPLTSIPNALTAVRLGLSRRGSALVGETFNSNTINLVAGVTVPALFVGVGSVSGSGEIRCRVAVAMTTVSLFLLARLVECDVPGRPR